MESVADIVSKNPKTISWILVLMLVVIIVLTVLIIWKMFKKENLAMVQAGNPLYGMNSPQWQLGGSNAGSDPNLSNPSIERHLQARTTQAGRDVIIKQQMGVDYPAVDCGMSDAAVQEAKWLNQANGGEYAQTYDQLPATLLIN